MTAQRPPMPSPAGLPVQIDALEKVLAAQLNDYRALLACVEQKTEAIRHAQMDRISEVFERETGIIQRIAEAERARADIIQRLSNIIRPGAGKSLRVTDIAEAQPDEKARTRLLAIAEQLRTAALEVRERSSRVRAASEALARHMSGVMQSVRSALSRAGVYEQQGRLAIGAQIDFSVDVRS